MLGGGSEEEPTTGGVAAPTEIVMYNAGTSNGNLGGRAGADALCAASGNRPSGAQFTNFRAFISVDATDEIRDMPGNYAVPTTLPIEGPTGTSIATNWADLLDGSIANSLVAAGAAAAAPNAWWSGSAAADGSLGAECSAWSDGTGGASGVIGNPSATNATWMTGVATGCNGAYQIICSAF